MDKTRRAVLKGMGGLVASMSLPFQFLPRLGNAAPVPVLRKLVVIQLKGGNDGVNTIVPMTGGQYGHYTGLRPDIALLLRDLTPFGSAPLFENPGAFVELGLNPALSGLLPLHDKLAVFPATHSGLGSDTSHFFQFDYIDNGYATDAVFTPDGAGWAGRFLDSQFLGQTPDGIISFDFGSTRKLFRGNVPSISLLDPENLDLGTSSQAEADAIWDDVKAASEGVTSGHAGAYAAAQQQLFDNALARLDPQFVDFNRTPGATYSGELGAKLRKTAAMLIGLPELEMVHLEVGGFDTHNNQVDTADTTTGRHADLLRQLGDSLAAFYYDLQAEDQQTGGNLLNNVAVVVMSEFGRTVDGNGNAGTDHGQATPWFAFGGPIVGGIYGDYPGLAPDQLVSNGGGRFWLRQTVDYRDILSELLGPYFLGGSIAQANAAFPGYGGAVNPLNFVLPPTA